MIAHQFASQYSVLVAQCFGNILMFQQGQSDIIGRFEGENPPAVGEISQAVHDVDQSTVVGMFGEDGMKGDLRFKKLTHIPLIDCRCA